jgi:hypothetical protein
MTGNRDSSASAKEALCSDTSCPELLQRKIANTSSHKALKLSIAVLVRPQFRRHNMSPFHARPVPLTTSQTRRSFCTSLSTGWLSCGSSSLFPVRDSAYFLNFVWRHKPSSPSVHPSSRKRPPWKVSPSASWKRQTESVKVPNPGVTYQ